MVIIVFYYPVISGHRTVLDAKGSGQANTNCITLVQLYWVSMSEYFMSWIGFPCQLMIVSGIMELFIHLTLYQVNVINVVQF